MPKTEELLLLDVIVSDDWWGGISAKSVLQKLDEIDGADEINVRINSPGGDVFAGATIFNALRKRQERITVDVEGLAASAAALITMIGDEIRMGEGAMLMIHNPWAIALGEADELRKVANTLDQLKEMHAQTFAGRSGNKLADVEAWMDEETWMTAAEAVERGFADSQAEPRQRDQAGSDAEERAQRWREVLDGYRRVPASVAARYGKTGVKGRPANSTETRTSTPFRRMHARRRVDLQRVIADNR